MRGKIKFDGYWDDYSHNQSYLIANIQKILSHIYYNKEHDGTYVDEIYDYCHHKIAELVDSYIKSDSNENLIYHIKNLEFVICRNNPKDYDIHIMKKKLNRILNKLYELK